MREINLHGVRIARQAAKGRDVFMAGSVGPLIRMKGEERELSADETLDIFRDQCSALAEGGVDLLILETFSDVDRSNAALQAARETGLAGNGQHGVPGRGAQRYRGARWRRHGAGWPLPVPA